MNEVWLWDVRTYQWHQINTTFGSWGGGQIENSMPPPREQHISAYIDGDIYVFGGKSHISGETVDTFYNDVWRLNIENPVPANLYGEIHAPKSSSVSFPVQLPQGQRVFLEVDGSEAANANTFDIQTGIGSKDMCIKNIAIKVIP